ncbi:MATE family efflux transporter [Pelagibacteraceae bacterium]|jgi:multidrug resistance protein, MATE family|nr:MATE family efflux transporter [Pelagibacteraceae bacterium]MDC0511495.1 MATE family efflux transporter [Pelagibacteraceae bacterium]
MKFTKYSPKFSKKQIFLLSIPVFFSNLAIPLVGMVDTGLMGNLGETKYLVATSIATSVMTMIIWSFGFLRMGTVGIVSQAYGKGDYREIVKTLLRNFVIAMMIALTIIILKPLIYNSIQYFFNTSQETQELINTYLSVRVFSVPAELAIYILVGFYLGIRKTKISSLLIIVLSILNIVFSSLLVLTYNLNIFGVVLGTLIASYTTLIIFTIFTYNFIIKKFKIIPKFEKLIIRSKLLKLFNINLDIFIRTLFLTFSFLWVTYLGSKLGEDYLAVNTILMQFIILAAFFLDAYAFATEGIIGFSVGRKNKTSFLSVVKNSIQISFFTALLISFLYFIFFKDIINLITNIEILRFISYKHVFWIIIIPPLASFCYQLDGIFIGASQTKEIRNAMIISVSIFIGISVYLVRFFDNHGIWFSLMLFMILRALTLQFYYKKILKKF